MDCGSGSGTIDGLGVCLAELVDVPNTASTPSVSIPPLDPNAATDAQHSEGFKPQWWQILLMVLGGLFIIILCIILWRRHARKKRAKRTQEFKAKLEHRGFWSRLWRNPFSIFRRKKKDNRAQDLEGARSSAGDWRTSASRTDEDRRTWLSMQESVPRRPSLTGRSKASDGYTYDEGRSQRGTNRPPYLGVPTRSHYGESQYGLEIEDENDYRPEGSYRAPRRDRAPRREPGYSRDQEQLHADIMNDQPSVYSQSTGQPRRRADAPRDLLTSRFSATTNGESLAASKVPRKPAPQARLPVSAAQSLREVESPEPIQRSDAENYKLSKMWPVSKNQQPDYSSSGMTAVDKDNNPFRKPSN